MLAFYLNYIRSATAKKYNYVSGQPSKQGEGRADGEHHKRQLPTLDESDDHGSDARRPPLNGGGDLVADAFLYLFDVPVDECVTFTSASSS